MSLCPVVVTDRRSSHTGCGERPRVRGPAACRDVRTAAGGYPKSTASCIHATQDNRNAPRGTQKR